LNQYSY